jgi:hypothetical protein
MQLKPNRKQIKEYLKNSRNLRDNELINYNPIRSYQSNTQKVSLNQHNQITRDEKSLERF